jgi:two-component system cell cycle sensor histidine kinase/response regulator CckA
VNGKVLVVDDEEQNRYLLRVLLESQGFEVVEAADGVQALRMARDDPPALAISDLLMPNMDGFSLCREWMHDERLRGIPFLVYSATYTSDSDRALVLDLGATAFLVKPAEPEVLVDAVQRALGRSPEPLASCNGGVFYERYSRRLREKLDRKLGQLACVEQRIVEYASRSEAIIDASVDAIISFDRELRIRSWSLSAEALLGHAEEDVEGQSLGIVLSEQELADTQKRADRTLRTMGRTRFEAHWRHMDGTLVDVGVSLVPLSTDLGFVAVVSDLTARRKAESEKADLEARLARAQRMESVGRLAGGVAHDFNNLLTVILSHAAFLEEALPANTPLHQDACRIREAGDRATALTRQLLAIASPRVSGNGTADVNQVVAAMETLLRRLIGEDIDLRTQLAHGVAPVRADASQVEQMVLNLVVNARDAMPDGGRLTVSTSVVVLDSEMARSHAPLQPGPFVRLTVTDTGSGIDQATLEHVFEPFFTTKEAGKGTGLGLSTVYGLARQAGGWVEVQSELGNGTVFDLWLPKAEGPPASRLESPRPDAPGGTGECVLVVEDDETVRTLTCRILERGGYRVLRSASPAEALRLLETLEEPIDLLLTDVVMPGMNGRELAQRVLAARPGIKVIYMSGYAHNALSDRGVRAGAVLVNKPFTAEGLRRVVRGVLNGKPSR